MLRFSSRRSSPRVAIIADRPAARGAEHDEPRAAPGLPERRSRAGFRPGSSRPAPSCSASTCRAARTSCSRSTSQDLMRAPDHAAARRRPPHPARDARVAPGRHPDHCRAACRSACRTPPTATGCCRSCGSCRSRSATPSSARPAATRHRDQRPRRTALITADAIRKPASTSASAAPSTSRSRSSAAASTRLGTTEPSIQRQGADRILVQVPGLQDPQRLKELLGQTAKLEFRLLAQPGATDVDMLPMRGCRAASACPSSAASSSRAAT